MAPSKIQDQELLDFLQENSRRRVSVVLYALRKKRVSVKRSLGALPSVKLSGPLEKGEAMDRLESDLDDQGLAQRARRNDLAQVFVLELTRKQLCTVAELPSVMRIRPNRWVLPTQGELFASARRHLNRNHGARH